MKRILLVGAVALLVATSLVGVMASSALALTKEQARSEAENYARHHYSGEPYVWDCNASGKNKAGEAQWYCYGYYNQKPGEWKVNVGPYPGEITYHNP
jgi:hypothetical protein